MKGCSVRVAAAWLVAASACAGVVRERCAWTGSAARPAFNEVTMTPLVVDLDLDGVAEVVFAANDPRTGTALLEIMSGTDCAIRREIGNPGCVTCFGDAACRDLEFAGTGAILRPWGLAAGDLDGDGRPEIVGIVAGPIGEGDRRLIAFDADGSFRWCSSLSPTFVVVTPLSAWHPSIADLDGDGRPEIVVGSAVFSADGEYLTSSPDYLLYYTPSVPADVDGDGRAEILVGPAAYRSDATPLWDLRWGARTFAQARAIPVDLDGDGRVEVVLSSDEPNGVVVVDGATGALRAEAALPPDDPACWSQPGAPSVGDVDGDGDPEIFVATGTSGCLFDWNVVPVDALAERWCVPVHDCSGGFTAGVFADLDGDGADEIALRDDRDLLLVDGDGTLLQSIPCSSGTFVESVVAADAGGDCAGEIVVSADSQSFGPEHGLRVYEGDAAPLPPFRPLWNQTAYHVTNVADDGRIPSREPVATSSLKQPQRDVPVPDVVASVTTLWPPNHRMVRVTLTSATGEPVRVAAVRQDEPVEDRADGRAAPDAVIDPDGDGVLLRAERSGRGDGRVYHLDVRVGRPGCEAAVTLTACVPHDMRPSRRAGGCVDQGPLFDSLAASR